MEGWEFKQLGDICEFQNGRSFKKEEWATVGLPIIRIQNLNSRDASFNYFAGDYDDRILVCDGDLLFSWSGTIGSSFGPHIWDRDPGVLNQHIFKVAIGDNLDKRYLYHALGFITADIERSVSGAVGLVHISKSRLCTFSIPVPPLAEQRRIVAILDEVFAAIETATAAAEKNLANARELFESWVSRELARLMQSCGSKRLEEVCDRVTVGHVGSMASKYVPAGIPFLRSKNVKPYRISMEDLVHIDEGFHGKLTKSSLAPGDLVIVRTGDPGTAAVIPDSLPVANCSDLVIVRPNHSASPEYLCLIFNSLHGQALVGSKLNGAAQRHFNITEAKRMLIPLPDIPGQRGFVSSANRAAQSCRQVESFFFRKVALLGELKQSLLQKAFRGEL